MHSHRRARPPLWAAVGAETEPLRRARQLQRSWERLVADGALAPELPPEATAGLRPTIVESWRRSLATGLDPTDLLAPIEADEDEVLGRWFEHPLGSLSHVLMEQLRRVAEDSRGMVVVTDASGLVLHRVGDEWLKERAAEMNLVEGARYSEAADGTNGIGTALAADHAFQVFAFEHFNDRHHEWVCSGAPVHDPVSGQTVGLIDVSSLWRFAHPRTLELVTTAARTIEQCLADARHDMGARLTRRYSDFMTKRTDLLVDRDGYVLDGAEPAHQSRYDIPEGGGEVVMGDGSVAEASPLGRGEAYLLRQSTTREAKPAVKGLQRTEQRARELAAEQAALRQVATLVARESSPDQLFAMVAEQVARIFDVPHVRLVLFEPDGSFVVGGFSEGEDEPFPIGSRWPLDSPGVTATVRQTGRPARLEDYEDVTGEIAAVARSAGMHSAVACPIVVERRLWGAMVVLSPQDDPLPEDTEARLTDFTELVATAIANAESREALAQLAEQQAALRRVATLVASGIRPEEVFQAVAAEVGVLFGSDTGAIVRFEDDRTVTVLGAVSGPHETGKRVTLDPGSAVNVVRETSRSARFDTDDPWASDMPSLVQALGIRSAVASPIVVQGELWGALTTASLEGPLPLGAERRLTEFTELVATAVANTQAREEVTMLADEQAALRRVAVLVAQQPSPSEVFTAVTQAVGLLLDADLAVLHVFPGDGKATLIAGWSGDGGVPPIGTRVPLDGDNLAARIFESGAPARIDSYAEVEEGVATDLARSFRLRSSVGAPILVEGKLWGALMAATRDVEPWAENAETRIAAFTELVATALANAESRVEVERLADEQATLRRIATLVAQGLQPEEIFAAVSEEASATFSATTAVMRFEHDPPGVVLVGVSKEIDIAIGTRWEFAEGMPSAEVYRTGRPARLAIGDDYWSSRGGPAEETAHRLGLASQVSCPITVEGSLWGVITLNAREELPPDTEERLEKFTELVTTAVVNAESREARARLTDEQAALRRVATLVARGVRPTELFSAVSNEVGRLFGSDQASVTRFDHEVPATVIVGVSDAIDDVVSLGTRWELHDSMASAHVFRTARSARVDRTDGYSAGSPAEDTIERLDLQSTVASPIVVEGRLWGTITVSSSGQPLPADTEQRLEKFTELVATAIANVQSREDLERLADEQAALGRVATLVAKGVTPGDLFAAVSDEIGRLFGTQLAAVGKFEDGGKVIDLVGAEQTHERWETSEFLVSTEVLRTGRPARRDASSWESAEGETAERLRALGIVSTVGSPIVVEDELWGSMLVASTDALLPVNTEERLEKFTELVATAIANAESREARAVLTEEQAALRRVATLVAQGPSPQDLFAAVTEAVGRLLPVGSATMGRYEPDDSVTTVASWSTAEAAFPTGRRWPTEGTNVAGMVLQTGRSARIDDFSAATDPIGVAAREAGMKSAVGSPIVVEGHLWGVMTATSTEGPFPSDTEARLASFTELVATAIANAESTAELAASRRRIVAASDGARRRIERDLHDGVQQQLVSLGMELGAMKADLPTGDALEQQLAGVTEGVGSVLDALVEIARGIHPAILSQGGLAAALKGLARRSAVPVELQAQIEGTFSDEVEVAAYYVAAESLTNAAKHARASVVHMEVMTNDGTLTLMIRDDGVGGADLSGGSGLVGLQDRVEALGGTIKIDSSRGSGTSVVVTLPIAVEAAEELENLLGPPKL